MSDAPKMEGEAGCADGRTVAATKRVLSFLPSPSPSLDGMGSLTLFVFLVLSLVLLVNAADLYKVLDR